MYPMIGAMQMPAGFKYKEILQRGRPSHEKWDSFFIKHPPMSPSRWAKIFAPFDALDGFDERIKAKEEIYDCIILDVMMPIMDGFEAIKRIRKLNIPSLFT